MNDMYIFLQSYTWDDTLVLDVQRIKNQITELSNQLDEFLWRLEILIHEISAELETDLMNLHNNDFKTDINRANISFKLSGKNNQLKTILSDTQRLKS